NQIDLADLPKEMFEGLEIVAVTTMKEVLSHTLEDFRPGHYHLKAMPQMGHQAKPFNICHGETAPAPDAGINAFFAPFVATGPNTYLTVSG
ncbi:MAG: hypothetical protein ACRCTY_03825, partial [Candidatus Adiutrix sp.]